MAMRMQAVVVLMASLAASCTSSSDPTPDPQPTPTPQQAIQFVRIEPFPEGPSTAACPKADPRRGCQTTVAEVADAVPDPLPDPPQQPDDCTVGSNVVIEFKSGDELTYGPCVIPQGIRALRTAITHAR